MRSHGALQSSARSHATNKQLINGKARWHSLVRHAASTAEAAPPKLSGTARSHDTDVVVIGSGIGGLSCAAMLAKYGYKVGNLTCRWLCGVAPSLACMPSTMCKIML
jgi:heterodisulfide reductase subunit A-like polyferredoxin